MMSRASCGSNDSGSVADGTNSSHTGSAASSISISTCLSARRRAASPGCPLPARRIVGRHGAFGGRRHDRSGRAVPPRAASCLRQAAAAVRNPQIARQLIPGRGVGRATRRWSRLGRWLGRWAGVEPGPLAPFAPHDRRPTFRRATGSFGSSGGTFRSKVACQRGPMICFFWFGHVRFGDISQENGVSASVAPRAIVPSTVDNHVSIGFFPHLGKVKRNNGNYVAMVCRGKMCRLESRP